MSPQAILITTVTAFFLGIVMGHVFWAGPDDEDEDEDEDPEWENQ